METNNTHTQLEHRVTDAIQSGKVHMHSPLHFTVRLVLLVCLLIGVLILSLVLINFIVFSIRFYGHIDLLTFGIRGFVTFFTFFPWFLLAVDVLLITASLYLIRTFRFGYTMPIVYLGLLLFVTVVGVGYMMRHHTDGVNESMMRHILDDRMSTLLPSFVEGVRIPPEKRPLCRCKVVEIHEGGIVIGEDMRTGRIVRFALDPVNKNATTSGLVPGDIVIIAHDQYRDDTDREDVRDAYGLRKVEDEGNHKGRGRGRGGDKYDNEIEEADRED